LTSNENKQSIRIHSTATLSEEVAWIAKDIEMQRRIAKNTKIMGRNRKLLEDAQKVFTGLNINSAIYQRKIEFESSSMRFFHSLLRLFSSRSDKICLQRVLAAFYQIEGINIDYHTVIGQSSFTDGDLFKSFVNVIKDHERIMAKTKHFISGITNDSFYVEYNPLIGLIFDWLDSFENENSLSQEPFSTYLSEKEIFNMLHDEIERENADKLSLSVFLQELDSRDKSEPTPEDAFELITIHAAKGLEFQNVYLIGMVDDILPSYNSIKNGSRPESLEEERRSCYVAITRTQESLTMTYANQYNGWQKYPSRFLYEMGLLNNEVD
jgi:DNA helicase-2/ATP-dependent DNA helicase PcrA